MIIYTDLLTGDELISDSYPLKEVLDGFFFEVDGKWVEVGGDDFQLEGANPSAEEADEGTDNTKQKVVDLIDSFRLVEQPTYDKKQFMGWVKGWLGKVLAELPEDQKAEFKAKSQDGVKHLLGKLKELQFFCGVSLDPEGTLVFAYYKDGAAEPTFLYPKYALKGTKV